MSINDRVFSDSITVDRDISIELPVVKKGTKTAVSYNGLLNNQGAEKLYLHYGFDGWNNAETVPMYKIHGAYSTEVKVNGKKELNFCFKDSADNWDNNNGANWKVDISSK